ncbi:hypothetical protein ACQEUX_28030 [Micromonospora sp. CA-259024]|uniref:hypothetical protein n=1 Tax=Micromonospora sp. CA-259024 TaxID=3239965 RepID=UPI003D946012
MARYNGMSEPSEYDQSMPAVQANLAKFERAWARVRVTHGGRPVEEVRVALAQAFNEEGVEVWSDVADEAARTISGQS